MKNKTCFNLYSQNPWTQRSLEVAGSPGQESLCLLPPKEPLKEMIKSMNTRAHGGDCCLHLELTPHICRLGLAELASTKAAYACCVCAVTQHSSAGMWVGNQKLCCPLIWCLTGKKIVIGTKPARGNGNMIPLTSSKKIAIVTEQRCWIFVGLGGNIFVSEMELTVEWVKVNYLPDDWRSFMQYSIIERGY